MKFLVVTSFIVVLVTLMVAYTSFKSSDSEINDYGVSFDCQNWYTPGNSFFDFIKVAWIQKDKDSEIVYVRSNQFPEMAIAVDSNNNLAYFEDELIFKSQNFFFHQKKNEVAVKISSRRESKIKDLIVGYTIKDFIGSMMTIDNHHGIFIKDNTTDKFVCGIKSNGKLCMDDKNQRRSWDFVIKEKPITNKFVDEFCDDFENRIKQLKTFKLSVVESCSIKVSDEMEKIFQVCKNL